MNQHNQNKSKVLRTGTTNDRFARWMLVSTLMLVTLTLATNVCASQVQVQVPSSATAGDPLASFLGRTGPAEIGLIPLISAFFIALIAVAIRSRHKGRSSISHLYFF